jgi:hypothetical protein
MKCVVIGDNSLHLKPAIHQDLKAFRDLGLRVNGNAKQCINCHLQATAAPERGPRFHPRSSHWINLNKSVHKSRAKIALRRVADPSPERKGSVLGEDVRDLSPIQEVRARFNRKRAGIADSFESDLPISEPRNRFKPHD